MLALHVSELDTPTVYPRVYGGTADRLMMISYGSTFPVIIAIIHSVSIIPNSAAGSSASASRNFSRVFMLWFGSIPVCTGEPRLCARHGAACSVYPRVYGGTQKSHGGH